MFKFLLSLLSIATTFASNNAILSIAPLLNHHQQLKPIKSCATFKQQAKSPANEQPLTMDINKDIGFYALKANYQLFSPDYSANNPVVNVTDISNNLDKSANLQVNQIGDPIINDTPNAIFMGISRLYNKTPERQNSDSISFKQDVEDGYSNSYGANFNFSVESEFKFSAAIFGESTKIGINVGFNYTHSQSHSQIDTVISPPQTVTIPPHTEADVTTTLDSGTASINLQLKGQLDGDFSGTIVLQDGTKKQWTANSAAAIMAAQNLNEFPFLSKFVGINDDFSSIYLATSIQTEVSQHGFDYTNTITTQPIS